MKIFYRPLFFILLFLISSNHLGASGKIGVPIIYILETKTLNEIEESGFSIGEMLGGPKRFASTRELYSNVQAYKDFADQIGKPLAHDKKTDQLPAVIPPGYGDIPNMVSTLRGVEDKGKRSSRDKKGGYFIRELANNSHYPYSVEYDGDEPRHFDIRWLYSPYAQFRLVGISNRIDRMDFNTNNCGEVRLIYRLSYKTPKAASSLPFFLNVVREYPKSKNCKKFVKKWIVEEMDVKSLIEGPLENTRFQQLETNFQSLRFTSGYMHDFGGQAMYMQRVFKKVNGRLLTSPLENSPNVILLEQNKKLFLKFIDFLKNPKNLNKLDQGYLNIDFDPQFLTKFSVSWSTLGRARIANRPYSKLYQTYKKEFDSIDLKDLKFIKSTRGLVERLNNLTCVGCHQSGGTAGFHFLGKPDPQFSHPFNRQEMGLSHHAAAEVSRRRAYLDSILKGGTPNRFRPHSILKVDKWNTKVLVPKFSPLPVGSLCFLDNEAFSVPDLCQKTNKSNLKCIATVFSRESNVLLGECVDSNKPSAGNTCWKGRIVENDQKPHERSNPIETFNFYSFQDKWKLTGAVFKDKKNYKCVLPQSGAPLGRMSRACTLDEEKFNFDFKRPYPMEVCANQGGKGFDLCAASGSAGTCLESKVARSMLDVCYDERYCREDYICQRFPDYSKIPKKLYMRKKRNKLINKIDPQNIRGDLIARAQNQEVGFCVPTYFIFNMRIDGHPNPVTGKAPMKPKFDRTKPLRGYK